MRGKTFAGVAGAILVLLAASSLEAGGGGPNIRFNLTVRSNDPPWSSIQVFDMSNRGNIVGEARHNPDNYWTAWTSSYGGLTGPGDMTSGYGINNRNAVVGYRQSAGGYLQPVYFAYEMGFYSSYSLQDGTYDQGQAYGINDGGQTVGYIQVHPAGVNHAVLWSDRMALPQDLGVLDTTASDPTARTSVAEDINTAGQVVGTAALRSDVLHAFLWSPGSGGGMEDLGYIGQWYYNSYAMAINDREEVVGYQTEGHYAWKWTRATGMQNLGKPPGCSTSQAYDINNDGLIVGQAGGVPGGGWLYMGGQPHLLDDLLTTDYAGWHIQNAAAITDSWWIAAYATDPGGGVHAVILTPTTNLLPTKNGDFGSTPGELPDTWVDAGDGTATTVTDPNDPTNVCVQLTTGSPIVLSTQVNTPSGTFYVIFDYQFTTTTGTLDVLLDGASIGMLDAPDPATGTWDTQHLVVDDGDLMGLADTPLAFELDGPTGSQVLLDNVTLQAIVPEPATLALLAVGLGTLAVRKRRT